MFWNRSNTVWDRGYRRLYNEVGWDLETSKCSVHTSCMFNLKAKRHVIITLSKSCLWNKTFWHQTEKNVLNVFLLNWKVFILALFFTKKTTQKIVFDLFRVCCGNHFFFKHLSCFGIIAIVVHLKSVSLIMVKIFRYQKFVSDNSHSLICPTFI